MEIREIELLFLESLDLHLTFVREAGLGIGVSIGQLVRHDLSKWSSAEFTGYAQHFHGGGAPDLFASAWLHHVHNNPHHWQHWLIPRAQVLEMTPRYVLEMVADWMGASMAYTGAWDMTAWLDKHLGDVVLHNDSTRYLNTVLRSLGYEIQKEQKVWK